MKKTVVLVVVSIFLFISPLTAGAENALDKLDRGIANTLTGGLALPYAVIGVSEDNGISAALDYRCGQGDSGYCCERACRCLRNSYFSHTCFCGV